MNSRAPIVIEAVVDGAERAALVAAGKQLGACLESVTAAPWPVELRFRDSIAAVGPPDRSTIVIASFLPEVERWDEPIAVTDARWRKQLASLDDTLFCVLVCTVFRCIATAPGRRHLDAAPARTERIRRVNLLAAELSHDTGVGVIDIDRVIAHVGARLLGTDYRLTGSMAAEVAAHAIVSALLSFGLDGVVPADVQDRATGVHGGVFTLVRSAIASGQRNLSA